MSDEDDKKHDPSERRLTESADRGELPRSQELASVASTVGGAVALVLGGAVVARPVMAFALQLMATPAIDASTAPELLRQALLAVGAAAALPLFAAGAMGGLATVAQTRFQIATRAFEARLEQIDPIATFQRVYVSKQPFVELARGAIQILVLGGVTAWGIEQEFAELPHIAALPAMVQPALLSDLAWRLLARTLPVMLALAALDYGWAWWRWWQSLMRTDQQARDDHKEQEGDPHVKGQRRRRMRELATKKGVSALKDATVLVTNPTHYAIGLRYRHGVDAAPVIVVKGIDHRALALRKEAQRLGIPMVEDRPLARALYAVQVGRAVPAANYGAVAKVLAVVIRRKRSRIQ